MESTEVTSIDGPSQVWRSLSKAEIAAKARQLERIRMALKLWKTYGPNLTLWVDLVAGAATTAGLWALGSLVPMPLIPPPVWAVASVIVGIAVALIVNSSANSPRTHSERIDAVLAAYDPVDIRAYKDLQAEAQRDGELQWSAVHVWHMREEAAFRAAFAPPPPKPRMEFVNRHFD